MCYCQSGQAPAVRCRPQVQLAQSDTVAAVTTAGCRPRSDDGKPETMPDIGAPSRDQHFARGHDRRIPGLATGADVREPPGFRYRLSTSAARHHRLARAEPSA